MPTLKTNYNKGFYLKQRDWQRYGVAFLSVACALVLKLILAPVINQESPFLLFFVAVLISAWYGGIQAGILATFLASLAGNYFFLSPYYSFKVDSFGQILRLTIFCLEGLAISFVVAALKSAKRQAEVSKQQVVLHQEILSQSEERYRAFIEQSSEGIWRFELEKPLSLELSEDEQIQHFYQYAYLAECNNAMAQMYGFLGSEEIIGARLSELLIQSEPNNIEFLRNFIRSKYRVHEAESPEVDQQGLPKYFLNNFVGIVKNNFLLRVWGTQRDITDSKQAEAALHSSEERFRATFNQAAVGIAHVSPEGKWLLVNQKLCDIVGYSQEELLELTFQDITHFDDLDTNLEYARQVLAQEIQTYSMEKRYIRKDGSSISANITVSLVRDYLGKPKYFIVVVEDIFKRKQAEDALHESEERFRATFNQAAVGIAHVSSEGKWLLVNQKLCDIVGYSRKELLELTFQDITYSDDLDADLEYMRQMLAKEIQNYSMEKRYIHKNGSYVWINLTASLVRKSSGEPDYFIAIVENITERKQIAEALQYSEERYRRLVELSPDTIFIQSEGKFVFLNSAGVKLFGAANPQQLIGKKVIDFIHPNYHKIVNERIQQLATGIDVPVIEEKFIRLDRTIVDVEIGASSFIYLDKPAAQVVARNVTERKQTEAQLKASLQEKEVLLKEIHHRVKNNLQIISSLFNLQSSFIENHQILEMLKAAENRVSSMALIHEQLYQSPSLAHINFGEYIRDLTTNLLTSYNLNSGAIALNLDLENVQLNIDIAIPCGLIINELVSNSLKYAFLPNTSGEISIQLKPQSNTELTCTISDNGIGLPTNFDFKDTESLGLQLVTALTNQIGGEINLKIDSGTIFQLTFPVEF